VGCGLVFVLSIGILGVAVIAYNVVLRTPHAVLGHTLAQASYDITASPDTVAPTPPLEPLPDADALAQRMQWDQDVYRKWRDEALAGYLNLQPKPAAYDDEAHAALKLLAYLSVWGDYYGEGLWQQYDRHAMHFYNEGANFTVWARMRDVHEFENSHSSNEESAMGCTKEALDFQTTHYPVYLKFLIYKSLLSDLITAKNEGAISPGPGTAFDKVPDLTDLALKAYGELLGEHLSNPRIFRAGDRLLASVSSDEPTLRRVSLGLAQLFEYQDKGDPLADVLKGDFYINDAWCARGSGWSSSVSQEGWQLFGDRLASANQILTSVYAAHPEQAGAPYLMMTVALGQQLPRDQMELWFQRGLKLTPDPFPLYMSKSYYLLPRWYGSDEDEWAFGLECAKSDDWATKTPAMLLDTVTDAAESDPRFYARPEIWQPIERVYRDYLRQFPNAITYRSRFLKCAVQGGHWDTAAEQLKLLGSDWDRSIFDGDSYMKASRLIKTHLGR